MNSKKTRKILFTLSLAFFIFVPITTSGAEPVAYVSLFDSKFGNQQIQFAEGLGPLFNQLFQIGLTASAILAVLFIAIGGFQYMTTDAVSGKTEGRDKIQNAIFGLLLALIIFIILQTINPRLLTFELQPEGVGKIDSTGKNRLDDFFQNRNKDDKKGGTQLSVEEGVEAGNEVQ